MIKVKVLSTLGLDLDKSSFELELAGNTLADVINQMAARYGAKVKEELLDEVGNLDYAYGIFSNGHKVNDLDTRIQDGTELSIVIMMGGG
ncbi:MoaD/ThiS family protein [Chloroflexota bacterium]